MPLWQYSNQTSHPFSASHLWNEGYIFVLTRVALIFNTFTALAAGPGVQIIVTLPGRQGDVFTQRLVRKSVKIISRCTIICVEMKKRNSVTSILIFCIQTIFYSILHPDSFSADFPIGSLYPHLTCLHLEGYRQPCLWLQPNISLPTTGRSGKKKR